MIQKNGKYRPGKKLKRLLAIHKGRCYHCEELVNNKLNHSKQATRDHIIPKAKGGTWELSNLVLSCRKCNNERGEFYLDQYEIFKVFRKDICIGRKWSIKITELLYETMPGANKDSLVTSGDCKSPP